MEYLDVNEENDCKIALYEADIMMSVHQQTASV